MTAGRDEAPKGAVRWWHCLLAGLAYAAATALSFPPVSWWWLTLAAPLAPALVAMRRPVKPGRAGLWCALGALPLWLYEMSWVWRVSAPGFVPLCAYLSVYLWLFVWLLARARSRFGRSCALAGAVLWTALEVLRGEVVWDGYPWYLVSQPLIDAGLLAMPVRVAGLYGLSFLAAALGLGVLEWLVHPPARRWAGFCVVATFAVWGLLAAAGAGSAAGPSARVIRVALVQTNVTSDNKVGWTVERRLADMADFEDLTRRAALGAPDVIVWPETMFPGRSLDEQAVRSEREAGVFLRVPASGGEQRVSSWAFAESLLSLQAELGVPMVVGAVGVDNLRIGTDSDGRPTFDSDGRFNSAFVLAGGRPTGERYDKIALTPFGEYMPYISAWPWLERQLMTFGAHGMSFDLSRGRRTMPLRVPIAGGDPVRVAAPICFEVTKPSDCRELVVAGEGAELIVNLTNDGWFGDSDKTRLQHLQSARWRSLELGVPMVRAANTGICAVIDARGRITASGVEGNAVGTRADGVLAAEVALGGNGRTFFASCGDVIRWPALGAGAILTLYLFVRSAGGGRGG